MDDVRFDALTRTIASRASRRQLLRGVLGLGVGAGVAVVAHGPADAARRGYAGPLKSTPTPVPICAVVGDPCGTGGECCSGCCVSGGGAPFACVEAGVCEPGT